ncbi:MAG: glycosyltransferase family 39 protein [Bacteroidales bacterium]|nr:glycosyltransferase family 39 protein [Bacteroidales bacterium]
MKRFKRSFCSEGLLFLILVTGAILRCYRLVDIPFTHDEFSAIIRTQFSTFGELIDKGIKIDGHPAGVQVFLYYWVKLFGVSEMALKIPFIFFGLVSVWLIYRIGKMWFNSTVGLVAASFLSFLQYPVMYSQIARPYSSGLCFALLMVFFWTNVVFHSDRKKIWNLAGYILAGALCAYDHHFCGLFAVMVAVTGLFYISRQQVRSYLCSNLIIIILYLPHIPIFLYQLNVGGVEGWLQKPRFDFIIDYLKYIFHFSVFIYSLVILLIILALFWHHEKTRANRNFLLISVIWFLAPFLIGYLYSTFRSSVLQYSVLIFSFPFLLFFLFGRFKTERPIHQVIVVGLIALVTIPSLILERKHYQLFYKAPYQEIVSESKRAIDSLGSSQCRIILGTKPEINPYYLKKLKCQNLPFIYEDSIGRHGRFLQFLTEEKSDYLAYGCISSSPWENYQLILQQFPYLIKHKTYCGGDFYLFSRIKPLKPELEYFSTLVNGFEPSPEEWGFVNKEKCKDSLPIDGTRSFYADTCEFSPTYSRPLRDLIHQPTDIIDVSAEIRLPLVFPAAWMVLSVTSNDKMIWWNAVPVNDYVKPGQTGKVYTSLRISDLELRHHHLIFKAYIWNPKKLPYVLDNFTIEVRKGNPVIYGLYRKLGIKN